MRYLLFLVTALLALIAGVIVAEPNSAPGPKFKFQRVFKWRNYFRTPPKIDVPPESPLLISSARYYSFMSIGSGIGGELNFVLTNRSIKPIHSYNCRYYSPVSEGNGAYGSQPDQGLLSGKSRTDSINRHDYVPLTLTIDFVQFADGTTWLSDRSDSTVTAEGLDAGAKAAALYLLKIMSRDGADRVIATLPWIHAVVSKPQSAESKYGVFGFYCGVTNTAVRVAEEFRNNGAEGVDKYLRSYRE
jgi:hypothetical protein